MLVNTAKTFAVGDLHSHVAFFTPDGVPGVSEDPVLDLSLIIDTPSNKVDGVIKAETTATLIIEDTGLVVLEDGLGSLDSNADDAVG